MKRGDLRIPTAGAKRKGARCSQQLQHISPSPAFSSVTPQEPRRRTEASMSSVSSSALVKLAQRRRTEASMSSVSSGALVKLAQGSTFPLATCRALPRESHLGSPRQLALMPMAMAAAPSASTLVW
eukprot:6190533-Pleurochrysis_carterae.AAC.3